MARTSFDPGITQAYTGRISRLVNPGGRFNVRRTGQRFADLGVFLYLTRQSWPAFLSTLLCAFMVVNLLFAGIYFVIGVEHLTGVESATRWESFLGAYFFSSQTLTTVGYGHIAPKGVLTSTVASIEALIGLLGFAIATGLLYTRFSKPHAQMRFSEKALVAPYRGGRALMFRVANRRPNVLMEIDIKVLLMAVEQSGGETRRTYHQLALERESIYFLPLAWTVVHPIDESSPLAHWTAKEFAECEAEFLILCRAFDDTFSQTVHAVSGYTGADVVWGGRFTPAFQTAADGALILEMDKIGAWERAELPR
jgi:inward rectifier potassium channel